MELYEQVSYETSRLLTLRYSSSFGISSRLLSRKIRPHIYAIYGLVRIADEIVDTHKGPNSAELLDQLQAQVTSSLQSGYSTNPIVQAFCITAKRYKITESLLGPFFESMRMDLVPETYTDKKYERYIHGSAEVIGLMCLRVFCDGDESQYDTLSGGARSLGSAYQKVNFLRDMSSDYAELGRVYFPGVTFDEFDEKAKQLIIADIKTDFSQSEEALRRLPRSSRTAVKTSSAYYQRLLRKLEAASVGEIKASRLSVSNPEKLLLLIKSVASFERQT